MSVIDHSFDVNDLIDGKVDIFQAYNTNEPFALEKAGLKPIIFDPKDYGFDFYSDILFTNRDEINNHKQRAIAFKEASIKGWKYAFDNIEESVDIIYKKYNSQNRSKEALVFEAIQSKKLAFYENKPLGKIYLSKIERMNDAYNIMNIIKSPIKIKDYILDDSSNKFNFLSDDELAFLKENQTLIVSNETNYPPYDFFENGSPKGYSVDLIKLIAKTLDINIKFETDTWSNLVEKFCDGKIDILQPTDKSEKVIQCGQFTQAIIRDTSQFLLRKDFKEVKNLEDLFGYTVASPKGWYQTEYFKKEYKDKLKIIEVENTLEAIENVRNGEADFAYDYGSVLRYYKTKYNFNGLKIEGIYSKDKTFGNLFFAVNNKASILYGILEKTLLNLNEAEKSNLQAKWFGIKDNKRVDFLKDEINYLNRKKSINICIENNFLPYEKLDENGNYRGIVGEIFELLHENSGIDFKIVKTENWSESLNYVKTRKCDLLTLAEKTENREKYLDFTKPYESSPYVIVTKNDKPFVDKIESLSKKIVAINKDYSTIDLFEKKYPNIVIRKVKDLNEGLNLVEEGEVFGYINILPVLAYHMQKNSILNLKINGKFDEKADLGIATRNDEPILNNIMQKLLDSIDAETIQNIYNKWVQIKFGNNKDNSLVWEVFGVFLLISFLLIIRMKMLRDNRIKLEGLIKQEIENSRKKDNLIFQQNKMASLGNMIATIAHQWRQPLGQLSMSQNIVLRQIETDTLNIQELEEIVKDEQKIIQFMSQTINTFQNFYKEDYDKEVNFKLIDSYEDVKYILNETIKLSKIELIEDIDKNLEIQGHRNYISQILFSILNNGIYFLKTRNIKNPVISISIKKKSNYINIEIKNNDGGIDEKIIDKIFDYGFSKREGENKSSGLGLYIVKLILEEKLNGKIKVNNTQEGIKFIISIPF